MRKNAAIVLGISVVLVIVALLVAPAFINVNQYRPQIEAKLKDRLGRDVSLGPMKLSFIPLAFRAENTAIADDPQFHTNRPFAQVQTFYVRPKLLPLLHHEIEIKNVELVRPSVEFIRNAQGVWNFSSLAKAGSGNQSAGSFSLDRLSIDDGQIAVTDLQQNKPRAVYDHIDLLVSDFAPGKVQDVDIRVHMPGAGEQTVAFNGKLGPLPQDDLTRTPIDGHLNLNAVSLSGLQRFMNVQELIASDAVISGSADVKDNSGAIDSNGNFVFRNPRIHGVDLGYPIGVDYQVSSDNTRSNFTIKKAELKLDRTPISAHGNINTQPSPAQVDMTVQASDASVAEAARLAAAFGTAFDAKTTISGNVSLDIHAQGALTKPAMNGDIKARDIRVSGSDLKEPVELNAIDLSLSPDTIRSNEFTAKTGHTSAAAQFTLTGYASDTPKVDAKLNTGNADVQELLRIAHAYGIPATEGMNGSGSITLNVETSGPVKQAEQMQFSGSGTIRNASLDLPALAKPVAVRKADLQFSGNGVNLNDLDASIGQTTAHGNLTATNFSAPQLQFSFSANYINVAEWEQLFKSPPRKVAEPNTLPHAAQSKSGPTAPPSDQSVLNRMTGTGTLTVEKVVYDDLDLTNVHSTATLDHGVITMKPLASSLYNGQESGTVVINTHTTPVTYTVDSNLQGVDANQLLSAISPVKQTLYGLLSANADTHFTTAAGARSILPTLNGKVSFNLKDGKIANVDLLHQLATIAQFQRTAATVEPFTQLIQLTGDFTINNGIAQTNNLKASMDAGSLAANGTVDLAHQRLDLHLTAVLSQNYSQTVGGTSIGGFLNTALANSGGELVIPVLVTGTLQEPHFAPDLQRVAQMKLQNLVPGIDNPSALTKGIFGQILRGKPGTAPPGQQGQPQPTVPNPLENLLDSLKKKK